MNSRGKLIVEKIRTSLSNNSIDKIVVLKTNTEFLKDTRYQCVIAQILKLSNSNEKSQSKLNCDRLLMSDHS